MAAPKKTKPTDDHGIDLSALLIRAVDRSGLSRYAIAKELGVSESTLSRPYNGLSQPSLDLLCEVAALAGLRVSVELKRAPKADNRTRQKLHA